MSAMSASAKNFTDMIATLIEPFAAISGSISKRDKLYVRVLNGRVLLQHKPRRQSSLQAFLRKKFGCDYGTARKKVLSSNGAPTEH